MHPSSSRAFQRQQEHDLKHPGSVDLITTKQNKLPCFIDRLGIRRNIKTSVVNFTPTTPQPSKTLSYT
jgi:hypothetical protein